MLTKKLDYRVTFHDPCCLGRHNGFYEEPRALLNAIPGVKLVEMQHHHANSLCCGGGGGGMWLDTYYKSKGMERLSDRRIKRRLRRERTFSPSPARMRFPVSRMPLKPRAAMTEWLCGT